MTSLGDALRSAGVAERFGIAPARDGPARPLVRAALTVTLDTPRGEAARALWAWSRSAVATLPDRWTDGEHRAGPAAVSAVHVASEEGAAWRLTVTPGAEASAVIDLAEGGGPAVVGVSVEGQGDPLEALFRPLARRLATMGARLGAAPLPAEEISLSGRDEVAGYVDRLLDPARVAPVVLITAHTRRSGEFAIGPAEAARACLGLATVVAVPGWNDTFAMSERLMKLGCYAGGVRIYWPGFALTDLLEAHPLYLGTSIMPTTLDAIVRRLASWSAAHYEPPEAARRLLSGEVRNSAVRSAIRSALESTETSSPAEPAPTMTAADSEAPIGAEAAAPGASSPLLEQVAGLAGQVADLRSALDDARRAIGARDDRIRELEAQVQSLRANLAAREDPYSGAEVTLADPESIEEAVILAEDYFVHELVITQAAHRSAGRMNPADNRPAKLWKALSDLARVVRRWRKNDLPQGIQGALRTMGWDPHSVSDTAIGQHTRDYCFSHDGAIVTMRFSLQLSRGERLYWARDDQRQRFLVGHIGQHLPDSTTG